MIKTNFNDTNYIPKTTLEQIVLSNKQHDWNLLDLVKNKNITLGFIVNCLDINKYFPYLILSPNIVIQDFKLTTKQLLAKCFTREITSKEIKINVVNKLLNSIDNKDYLALVENLIHRFHDKHYHDIIASISQHPRTDLTIIEKYISYLDIQLISRNPNINRDFIKKYRNKLNWKYLSLNESITYETITNFQEIKLVLANLIDNPSFKPSWAIYILLNTSYEPANWISNIRYQVSCHPKVDIDCIEKNISKPWCWKGISNNPNINIDFIIKHLDKPIYPIYLSRNKKISMGDFNKYRDLSSLWNYNSLGFNPNIDGNTIRSLRNKINYNFLSKNPDLDIEFVLENKSLPWNWRSIVEINTLNTSQLKQIIGETNYLDDRWLSISKNIKGKISDQDLKSLPWNLDGLCCNPHITQEVIQKIGQLDSKKCSLLAKNQFSFSKEYNGYLEYNDETKHKCHEKINIFKDELMQKTWEPMRIFSWCLDIQEITELKF